jgi:hypothetical protein
VNRIRCALEHYAFRVEVANGIHPASNPT